MNYKPRIDWRPSVHHQHGPLLAGVDDDADRRLLIEFYSKYAPKKVSEVDRLLSKRPTAAGRARMWQHLKEHYPAFFEQVRRPVGTAQ